MKFSNKSLKKFIKGACYFEEKGGYLGAYHYSKAQLDWLFREGGDEFWSSRAIMSGGIRLELKTDSTELCFDYKGSNKSDKNSIDLYIDGVLTSVFQFNGDEKGTIHYNLPKGWKLVTVFFPCDSSLKVKNLKINGSYKTVKDKGDKVLVIGDSISQGYGPTLASCSYVNALIRKTGLNILNQGIGGYRFEPQDLMTVDGFEPDKIIVALGTNYYEFYGKELGYNYGEAVKEFYKRLIELFGKDIPVLNITPLWRNNDVDFAQLDDCIEAIKAECRKYDNITVVDGFDLIPHVDECFCDKIHPNDYGCELMASKLVKIMKDIKF